MRRRLLSLLLVLAMVTTMISFNIGYAYDPAKPLPALTGDQAHDLVMIANSQKGYSGHYSDDTIYGATYGVNGYAWCTSFVIWCAEKAGISSYIIPHEFMADNMEFWFRNKGLWKTSNPQHGDLIFFDRNNTNDAEHVGIVDYVANSYVYILEGNTSNDVVAYNGYSLSDPGIWGYASPQYKEVITSYTVSLNNQSATTAGTTSVTATYGSAMPSITAPKKTGYTFGGYFTGTNGSGIQYYTANGTSARVWDKNSTITLYAQWIGNVYGITLDSQGATTEGTKTLNATFGSPMPTIKLPQKDGYMFAGYFDGMDGSGLQYYNASGESVRAWNKTADTRLYAKWSPFTFEVRFHGNGGTVSFDKKKVIYNTAYGDFPVASRVGYTLKGWTNQADGGISMKPTQIFNYDYSTYQDIYAQWTGNVYGITLDSQGATTEGTKTLNATFGSPMPTIKLPQKDGYMFAGYFDGMDGSGLQYYNASGESVRAWNKTADTRLYAKWSPFTFEVRFHGNGGTVSFDKKKVIYNTAYGDFPVARRVGYTLKGWTNQADGGISMKPTQIFNYDYSTYQDIYAQWTGNVYGITLDSQGATTEGTKTLNATFGAPMPTITLPQKIGHAFGGYFDGTNGGGLQYYNASGESVRAWNKTENTRLYAKWIILTYEVFFHGNGGETSVEKKKVQYDTTYGELPIPSREGYRFVGWYTSSEGGYKISDTSIFTSSNSMYQHLYAHWEQINDLTISTVNGAQIRTGGVQGLRFISSIDKTSLDFDRVVEYGTILIPSADITDISELQIGATLNGHAVAKVPANYIYDETDDAVTFTAVITNVAAKNYAREYTARAYAIMDDGSVVYADTGASRSIYAVAKRGLENPNESDANKEIFQSIVDTVEGEN